MTHPLWQLDQINMQDRLSDLSLSIAPGITAVLGTSGAGKTSLLNLLVEFEPPEVGEIQFNCPAKSIEQLPVFWVPQDDGLWPHLSVEQHLTSLSDQTITSQWLDPLDLSEHAHKKPAQLSRGQQNRLAVARAMVSNAAVLIMDEPLSHVAQKDAMRYWALIMDHINASKQSLIFATHDPRRVLAYADQVICLEDGVLLEQGATQTIYQSPTSQASADLLGPANWLPPEVASVFFGSLTDNSMCVRPEQLQISLDAQSEFQISQTQFHGSVQQSTIENQTKQSMTLWHLPMPHLKPNDRIKLHIISLFLLLTLFITGCKPSPQYPEIKVKQTHIWVVPVDDISVPSPRSAKMLPDGQMVVLDTAGRVLIYNKVGKVVDIWHLPTNKNGNPEGTCLLKDGHIAVADTHYHQVVFFDVQGKITRTFGTRGEGPGQFIYPVSVTQDEQGNIYVVEYGGNDRVQKFTANMKHLLTFGKAGTHDGEFQRASGSLYLNQKLYVADAINNRILIFDTQTGKHVDTLGQNHLDLPYDIAYDPIHNHFYIAEYGSGRITQMDLSGTIIATFGSTGRGEKQFMTPWALTITPDRKLRIMDTGNRRIVELEL